MSRNRGVPLTLAAQRLRMSRERVVRRVLTGELLAWKNDEGRWVVDERSLEALCAANARGVASRAALGSVSA
jgi:hypothetical protein